MWGAVGMTKDLFGQTKWDTDAWPVIFDEDRAQRLVEDLTNGDVLSGYGGELLRRVASNSGFLTRIMLRDQDALDEMLSTDPVVYFDGILDAVYQQMADLDTDPMAVLRIAKRRAALHLALCDAAGVWPVLEVTSRLSALAEAGVTASLRRLFREALAAGEVEVPTCVDNLAPDRDCGYFALGMGKLGGHELNYSSDIDLVVFYDPDKIVYTGRKTLKHFMIGVTQKLVKWMQENTADGYLFRTDLRLRPDPGATPVAVTVTAAEQYYESMGQNWERAAMIKARPVGGDLAAAEQFLTNLRPFIWRKFLDFATIQDIQSIKRQIHAHGGHQVIAVNGHNIKLGRGGIREIEFFVQTQQLIAGGRDPDLRGQTTLGALNALCEKQWVTAEAVEELTNAYLYLRKLEHRIQMVEDEQSQTLPKSDDGIRHMACFMGYDDVETFRTELVGQLQTVQRHYAGLFEDAPDLASEEGSLVFTGTDTDPETVQTLEKLGFQNGGRIAEMIQNWHRGRYRALRTDRSRALLTDLMPRLVEALARTADPDGAFMRFDTFIQGLPAGVQLFSLFTSHPPLLELVAHLMGTAPRLSTYLSRNVTVLDMVLSPDFYNDLYDRETCRDALTEALQQALDFQDVLDIARRWNKDNRFRIGVQMLTRSCTTVEAGRAFTDLAQVALEELTPYAQKEVETAHGQIAGGEFAIIALGKLGSGELTEASDLDVVFVYDVPSDVKGSDGKKPIAIGQYYTRLCQKLVNLFTAPTGEGMLYEIDTRLRPAGNAGPLAVSFEAFKRYQETDAWTFEHMALTRARVIGGSDVFRDKLDGAIREILTTERDREKTLHDIADMRQRLLRERGPFGDWDLKLSRGGLVDIEFISQSLQLVHAHEHPHILRRNIVKGLEALGEEGLLDAAKVSDLSEAFRLQLAMTHVLRVAMDEDAGMAKGAEAMPADLKALLTRAGDCETFEELEEKIRTLRTKVMETFDDVIPEIM